MKSAFRCLWAVAFVALLSFGAGCITRTDSVWIEQGKMVVNNAVLASSLQVKQDAGKITPEGFLRVQVRVINKNSHDLSFQYRFKWLDRDGLTISQISAPWQPMTLHGTEVHELEGVSGVKGAEDFRLEIRQ